MADRQVGKGMCLNDGLILNVKTDLTLEGSTFQREGAPRAKAIVPMLVLTLRTKHKF